MKEMILALALLAPAPGLDPAPRSFEVAIDSRTLLPDGRILVLKGTVTGTIEEAGPPVPIGPTITALKNASGQGVEQIRSGEVLVIEGLGLWKEGVGLRVQLPGHRATALSMSPTKLEVRFLPLQARVTGPLQVYHYKGGEWVLITTGPRFTVLPSGAPLPPAVKPVIRSFGNPSIRGEGFGSAPGRVWARPAGLLPVLSWDDSEVRIDSVPPGVPWYPLSLWLETAQGEWATWAGFVGEVR